MTDVPKRGRPSVGNGDTVIIRLRVGADLLARIDRAAERLHQNRSEFLREAIEKSVTKGGRS